MTTISATVDDSVLKARLRSLSDKGLAYATQNALNNVAFLISKAEKEQVEKDFTLRNDFIKRQTGQVTKASATQAKPFAEVFVAQKPRLLLGDFEQGGIKQSATGAPTVGVPVTGTSARPSFSQPVPKTLFLRSLKIKAVRGKTNRNKTRDKLGSTTNTIQFKGINRTFLLKKTARHPKGGVFQRVGPKKDDIRMIYSFKPQPKLKALLGFVKTAQRVGNVWLQREFEQQIAIEIEKTNRRS